MDRNITTIALGTVVAYTVYLLGLGYRLTVNAQSGWGELISFGSTVVPFHPILVFLPSLLLLGGTLGIAYEHDLKLSLGVVALFTLVYPWIRPAGATPFTGGHVFGFVGDVLFLSVTSAVFVGSELTARRKSSITDFLTRRNVAIGTLVGVVHLAAVGFIRGFVLGESVELVNASSIVFWLWIGAGLVLLMMIPVSLLLEYRIVTPTLLVVSTLAVTALSTVTASDPNQSVTPTLLSIYMVFWFVPLLFGVLSGGAEYALRRRGNVDI